MCYHPLSIEIKEEMTPIQMAIKDISEFNKMYVLNYTDVFNILSSYLTKEKEFAKNMFDVGFDNALDTSDFPMGDCIKKEYPNFEEYYKKYENRK